MLTGKGSEEHLRALEDLRNGYRINADEEYHLQFLLNFPDDLWEYHWMGTRYVEGPRPAIEHSFFVTKYFDEPAKKIDLIIMEDGATIVPWGKGFSGLPNVRHQDLGSAALEVKMLANI